ncbi:MAG: metallophosphoesterase [Deltaproteobacteria bacterium]|nr:metallophosphoesterase [Deltaproteobacteria bacterium]
MLKFKIVVSDFHIGRGRWLPNGTRNYLEDFFYDDKFIEFLRYYREGIYADADVELICNGDFFNHLQLDIWERDPDVISEKVALRRTEEILKGHPEVFEEMRRFAEAPKHRITFILGNHDPGLLFPSVCNRLREVLGTHTAFQMEVYRFDGVHIEHGHQFFADNAYNSHRYFLTKDLPEPIVNLPWGSFFVIHFLNRVRQERPYFSKIYPFKYYLRWALIHDTQFAIKSVLRILFYFIWLRLRKDPHRRSSILRTFQIIKEVGIAPNLNEEAKKILLTERNTRIVIFSHTHHAGSRKIAPDKTYLNTGLWNEQISLEISNPGRLVDLTYALLEYDEKGIPQVSLKKWKGVSHPIEEVYD